MSFRQSGLWSFTSPTQVEREAVGPRPDRNPQRRVSDKFGRASMDTCFHGQFDQYSRAGAKVMAIAKRYYSVKFNITWHRTGGQAPLSSRFLCRRDHKRATTKSTSRAPVSWLPPRTSSVSLVKAPSASRTGPARGQRRHKRKRLVFYVSDRAVSGYRLLIRGMSHRTEWAMPKGHF